MPKGKFWLALKSKIMNRREVKHRKMLLREVMASWRLSNLNSKSP